MRSLSLRGSMESRSLRRQIENLSHTAFYQTEKPKRNNFPLGLHTSLSLEGCPTPVCATIWTLRVIRTLFSSSLRHTLKQGSTSGKKYGKSCFEGARIIANANRIGRHKGPYFLENRPWRFAPIYRANLAVGYLYATCESFAQDRLNPRLKAFRDIASEGIKMLQARDLLNDQVMVQPLECGILLD